MNSHHEPISYLQYALRKRVTENAQICGDGIGITGCRLWGSSRVSRRRAGCLPSAQHRWQADSDSSVRTDWRGQRFGRPLRRWQGRDGGVLKDLCRSVLGTQRRFSDGDLVHGSGRRRNTLRASHGLASNRQSPRRYHRRTDRPGRYLHAHLLFCAIQMRFASSVRRTADNNRLAPARSAAAAENPPRPCEAGEGCEVTKAVAPRRLWRGGSPTWNVIRHGFGRAPNQQRCWRDHGDDSGVAWSGCVCGSGVGSIS